MRWTTREPCSSCPYRRDAKLALWHPEEFLRLLANDRDQIFGAIYACHGSRESPEGPAICGGWLLDQKRRRAPSIQLRLALIHKPEAVQALNECHDGGHPLYGSILEMVEANIIASGDQEEE